jgi:hypothetical protein
VNINKVCGAIDSIIKGLSELKEAILENTPPDNRSCFDKVNLELLARQMAYSYSTLHPEYKIDSQFNNLCDMVNGPKISYVIAWVKKNGTTGLEEFFQENNGNKQMLMKEALSRYEDKIKEVFTKRFSK